MACKFLLSNTVKRSNQNFSLFRNWSSKTLQPPDALSSGAKPKPAEVPKKKVVLKTITKPLIVGQGKGIQEVPKNKVVLKTITKPLIVGPGKGSHTIEAAKTILETERHQDTVNKVNFKMTQSLIPNYSTKKNKSKGDCGCGGCGMKGCTCQKAGGKKSKVKPAKKVKKKKKSGGGGGGILWFALKSLIAAGTVYTTIVLRMWGTTDEAVELLKYLKQGKIPPTLTSPGSLPNDINKLPKNTMLETKYHEVLQSLSNHIQKLPETILQMYQFTEQQVKKAIKGNSDPEFSDDDE